MLYQIRALPNSKQPSVVKDGDTLRVQIDAPPVGGKANRRMLEILAEYFNVAKNRLVIVSGHTSRNKIIKIINNEEK